MTTTHTHKMKTSLIIAFLLVPLALVLSGSPTGSPAPYEIVLVGEKVVFDKAETVSSQLVIRDLGMKELIAPTLLRELSVIWDGKSYKREGMGPWNGPREIFPKTALRERISLSDFRVPAEALTAGRHTIAIKDAVTDSNTLTVFIEKTN